MFLFTKNLMAPEFIYGNFIVRVRLKCIYRRLRTLIKRIHLQVEFEKVRIEYFNKKKGER